MSPAISRTAAFALTVVSLALLAFGVILPTIDRFRVLQEETQELESQLARFNAADLSAPPMRIDVAEQALIEAESAALAAVRVQAALDAAVAASGGALRSLRIDDAVRMEAFWKVPVTIDLDIDALGLQRLTHRIESHRPYLFVERLDARRLRGRRGGGQDGAEEPAAASLRLRVFGLMQAAPEP